MSGDEFKSAASSLKDYYYQRLQRRPQSVPRRAGYDYHEFGDYDSYSGSPPQSSSFSSYGGGHGKVECCPLVVKPLVLAALLGVIGLATAFLAQVISMTTFTPPTRKRKRDLGVTLAELGHFLLKGKHTFSRDFRSSGAGMRIRLCL